MKDDIKTTEILSTKSQQIFLCFPISVDVLLQNNWKLCFSFFYKDGSVKVVLKCDSITYSSVCLTKFEMSTI
ncbi:hypothetical protein AQUCO_01100215v1 [Aquilegia coerulea]|uniref:Uncharacterized protein n=1 Tax=Aquilegia coerulea TaxID=218851 RepID=A0A2G5E624_AQUCA|nr:hypothetical protein AQUCO_01100215v1 [Aquilegia coerulea]